MVTIIWANKRSEIEVKKKCSIVSLILKLHQKYDILRKDKNKQTKTCVMKRKLFLRDGNTLFDIEKKANAKFPISPFSNDDNISVASIESIESNENFVYHHNKNNSEGNRIKILESKLTSSLDRSRLSNKSAMCVISSTVNSLKNKILPDI